jgi:biopolymer transport protein ExbD
MGMQVGGKGGGSIAEINITPMIDVLLVLLVIFMIATPMLQKSIDTQLPDKESQPGEPAPMIILEIGAQGELSINTQPVAKENLLRRLKEIYDNRPDKVLFVKADGEVTYQEVISAMDAARGAGVAVLGSVLPN